MVQGIRGFDIEGRAPRTRSNAGAAREEGAGKSLFSDVYGRRTLANQAVVKIFQS